ncbi:MAG: hypothetical protein IPN17_36790 [Deltaproteobacteria bacterium]|nr:hypothetical protein [Deltaproteobacteria bacterium]
MAKPRVSSVVGGPSGVTATPGQRSPGRRGRAGTTCVWRRTSRPRAVATVTVYRPGGSELARAVAMAPMALLPLTQRISWRTSPQPSAGCSATTTASLLPGAAAMFTSLVWVSTSGSTASGPAEVMAPAQLGAWSCRKPAKETTRSTPSERSPQGPGGIARQRSVARLGQVGSTSSGGRSRGTGTSAGASIAGASGATTSSASVASLMSVTSEASRAEASEVGAAVISEAQPTAAIAALSARRVQRAFMGA